LLSTATWHALAAYHFTCHPHRTLQRVLTDKSLVNASFVEMLRFLGGLNVCLAVLPLLALRWPRSRLWPVYFCLFLANLSQFLQDLRVHRLKLVKGKMFRQIMLGDAIFSLLNLWFVIRSDQKENRSS